MKLVKVRTDCEIWVNPLQINNVQRYPADWSGPFFKPGDVVVDMRGDQGGWVTDRPLEEILSLINDELA